MRNFLLIGFYMNYIQYIPFCHTTKEQAKSDLKKAYKGHIPVYIKSCSFEEICSLLTRGSTIRRLGDETTFVCLDVDDSSVPYTTVRSALEAYSNIRVVLSASGNPLKYHILQDIPLTPAGDPLVRSINGLKRLVLRTLGDVLDFDAACDKFDQPIFGQPSPTRGKFRLKDSSRISRMLARKDMPEPSDLNEYFLPDNDVYLPYNSAQMASEMGVYFVHENGYRFDVLLPCITRGRMQKIKVGCRFFWCQNTINRLLLRTFHLRTNCGYDINKAMYERWVEATIFNNVQDSVSFLQSPDYRSLQRYASRRYDEFNGCSFEYQVKCLSSYFSKEETPAKPYRSRKYIYDLISTILDDLENDGRIDAQHRIHVPNKQYLRNTFSLYDISPITAIRIIRKKGYSLTTERRSCIDGLNVVDGVLTLSEPPSDTISRYCRRHGITIVHPKKRHGLNEGILIGQSSTNHICPPTYIYDKSLNVRQEEENCPISQEKAISSKKPKEVRNKKVRQIDPLIVSLASNKKKGLSDNRSKKKVYLEGRIKDIQMRIKRGFALSHADRIFKSRHPEFFPKLTRGKKPSSAS